MSVPLPRIAQLSPQKLELLRRHLAGARPVAAAEGIRPHGVEVVNFPLSFAQRRLWFLDRLQPGMSAYNVYEGVRLTGGLDRAALAAALAEAVRRHDVLRARFVLEEEGPVQVIAPWHRFVLPLADLSALPRAILEVELQRLAAEAASRPFDLARGPVHRFLLLRSIAGEHALLLVLHHIACDAWSKEILFGELQALYRAFAAGLPNPLAEPPIQYVDFAIWQGDWLRGENMERQLAYWRQRLAGAPAALALPVDRSRPLTASLAGARQPLELPRRLVAPLRELARREGATLFMVLLAAFAALLHRCTGQDDVLVGSPVANRSRPEVERLVGLFVNTLVLRSDLAGAPTFRALIARVREASLGAFAHAELPFERIVEALQPERDLARTPLFQVLFTVLAEAPQARGELAGGIAVTPLPTPGRSARFDLDLTLVHSGEQLGGGLEYSTDLFDGATAARLAGHLLRLVESAVTDADQPVADLSWLAAAQRQQLIAEWNDSRAARADCCLHELIAGQAARTPDAVAIECGERRLTYRDLLRRAGALACRLRSLGVGAESRVGIAAERSAEAATGMLGVLIAGASYVPLDPDDPAERLAYMIEDSAVSALLTRRSLLDRLPALPRRLAGGSRVLDLDDAALWTPAPGAASRPPRVSPESPAYAIYTSGSTGRPKGVVTPHRGIVNTLLWMQEAYRLGATDRVALKTPFGFDVSLWEIFWPLLAGARVVVAPAGVHRQPADLAALVRARGITLLAFVPSLLQVFLEQPGLAAACRSVRRVLVIGEALPFELKERFFERLPAAELHNLYGPTEASVHVTHHPCERGGGRRSVAIGRPIANSSIFLLDRQLGHVPVGVAGEIFIGGSGLARGYLGRPGLTAERFVAHPAAGPGGRLYRTGDLARQLPDGCVEYLGRLDFQVKVRGVRVELGEIEANLDRHPAVRASVVVARQHAAGGVYLTAYVVAAGEPPPSPAALRAALRETLPDTMVPDVFVALSELPLNSAGKVDRRALPAAEVVRDLRREPAVLPRSLDELRLANLWQELLGVHPIGVHDNFFDLGGHSLLAVRLMTRIERLFGRALPLAELFAGATVASLALALRRPAAGEPVASPLVEIQAGEHGRAPLFLVHPAGGNLLCYLPLAHCLGRDQPIYGLQDPAVYQTGEPRFAIGEMAALYRQALRAAQPRGPYQLGGWSLGAMVAHEMARQLELDGEEVSLLLLLDPSAVRREGDGQVSEERLLLWFAAQLRVELHAEELAALAPALRFPFVLARCQDEKRLPTDLEPAQARRIFDLYAAEMNALGRHCPLPCRAPTLLLRAAGGAAGEPAAGEGDARLEWQPLTGALEVVVLPGSHQSLLDEPDVRALAHQARGRLDALRG